MKDVGKWLVCRPDFFDVRYEINPWMSRERAPVKSTAGAQWEKLHTILKQLGADLLYVDPAPAQPDMVFTANAGLQLGDTVVLSSFRHSERQGEEEHFQRWFEANNFKVVLLDDCAFEGEGDALFAGDTLFMGSGFRTDEKAAAEIKSILNLKEVVVCGLVDPYFYHIDTCFCPITDDTALIFPGAFSPDSLTKLRKHLRLIEIPVDDAKKFACNAVVLDKDIVLPAGADRTYELLAKEGFSSHPVELSEFMKAGGAAKCLTMKISRK